MKTFKQFKEEYWKNNKYSHRYSKEWKKQIEEQYLKHDWLEYLKEEAKTKALPHWVITDFINKFNEQALFDIFRGVYQKGISEYKIPKKVKELSNI